MSTTIRPGETNSAKLTVYFAIYDINGNICSGEGTTGTTAVVTATAGDVQVEHERDGYSNCAGTFGHNASGEYFYTFAVAETAVTLAEGTVAVRFKKTGYRTVTVRVDFTGALFQAGQVKPNSMLDNFVYTGGHLTSWRERVFVSQTAANAATAGNTNNTDGEIERFLGAATYDGSGNLTSYKYTKDL